MAASGVVRLKARGGDRAKNLNGIADRLVSLSCVDLSARERHELRGLAEQLRIVAGEWSKLAAGVRQ